MPRGWPDAFVGADSPTGRYGTPPNLEAVFGSGCCDGVAVILISLLEFSLVHNVEDSTHLRFGVFRCVLLGGIHMFLRVLVQCYNHQNTFCGAARRTRHSCAYSTVYFFWEATRYMTLGAQNSGVGGGINNS